MSELVTQNQLEQVVTSGSQILEKSVLRVEKALAVGQNILAAIEENGMSPELDERCNKYLVNCRGAKTEIEAERKPITAFFDTIRKHFTETEGKLDISKPQSVPAMIQGHRNAYVRAIREAEEEKRKAALLKLQKDNEAIEINTSVKSQLSSHVQGHITERKQKMQDSFNSITLEGFEARSKALKGLVLTYKKEHFNAFAPTFMLQYHNEDEFIAIKDDVLANEDYNLIAAVVVDELTKFKNDLVEKLPSLKNELERLAIADEEEKQRIANEKAQREADDRERIEREANEQQKKTEQDLEQQKVAEQTEAMMGNISITETIAPETRDGYKIVLLHQSAAAEIFTFWFQREGMNLTIEEIEKKSIAQMKTYCEKVAHKNDDKIISKNLRYEAVYKAVNRK